MVYGNNDEIPLTDQSSSSMNAPSTSNPNKLQLTEDGIQPSFALELDISTIKHVRDHIIYCLRSYSNVHIFQTGMVRYNDERYW